MVLYIILIDLILIDFILIDLILIDLILIDLIEYYIFEYYKMDTPDNYDEFYKLLKNYTNVFYKNLLIRYLNKPNYLEMLYVKGLFLLKNIYMLLFFYCTNINELALIVEKAYIYYIEFLIQINLNSMNMEFNLRDAVLFTYKRTVLSYKKQSTQNQNQNQNQNKELDTYFNILCNFFYLTYNRNFIENDQAQIINDTNYINSFIIKKLNSVEELEKKLRNYVIHNKISEINNNVLQLRDKIENNMANNTANNTANNMANNMANNTANIIHNMLSNLFTATNNF